MLETRGCCNGDAVLPTLLCGNAECNVLADYKPSASVQRGHRAKRTLSRSVSFSECLESEIPMIVPNHFLGHRWESQRMKHPSQLSVEQAAWENMTRMANNHKKMGVQIWDASAVVADVVVQCKGISACLAFLHITGAPPVFSS